MDKYEQLATDFSDVVRSYISANDIHLILENLGSTFDHSSGNLMVRLSKHFDYHMTMFEMVEEYFPEYKGKEIRGQDAFWYNYNKEIRAYEKKGYEADRPIHDLIRIALRIAVDNKFFISEEVQS